MRRFLRWQTKFQRMMKGRYGHFDQLNRTLIYISIVGMGLNMFLNLMILRIVPWLILLLAYYRFFSKRIYPRANENTKYLAMRRKVANQFSRVKRKLEDRHTYKYFACPNCTQNLRAPKGKGKIKITCSKCQNQFIKNI